MIINSHLAVHIIVIMIFLIFLFSPETFKKKSIQRSRTKPQATYRTQAPLLGPWSQAVCFYGIYLVFYDKLTLTALI